MEWEVKFANGNGIGGKIPDTESFKHILDNTVELTVRAYGVSFTMTCRPVDKVIVAHIIKKSGKYNFTLDYCIAGIYYGDCNLIGKSGSIKKTSWHDIIKGDYLNADTNPAVLLDS